MNLKVQVSNTFDPIFCCIFSLDFKIIISKFFCFINYLTVIVDFDRIELRLLDNPLRINHIRDALCTFRSSIGSICRANNEPFNIVVLFF